MRKPEFYAGIFLALCLALSGGVWYSVRELDGLKEEYFTLEIERDNNEAIISNLEERSKILWQMKDDSTEIISDAVVFYSQISQIIEDNNVNILSRSADGNNLTLQLLGDYYGLVNVLADWLTMPFAFRVNSLTIRRSTEEPKFFVDVIAVLEIMTE